MITPSAERLQVRDVTPQDASSHADSMSWQQHLQQAIRDTQTLGAALNLTLPVVETDFPILVPKPYLSKMSPGNPRDPLLLQVLPQIAELEKINGFNTDPVGEGNLSGTPPGLLQKYQGRALVTLTGACAVNCRYCFRRHFPYAAHQPGQQRWREIMTYLVKDDSISEVILSGGDPLVISDERLSEILKDLSRIAHLDTVRIHSRLPVVIPQRVTDKLVHSLSSVRLNIVVVLHINHPNEIDDTFRAAARKMKAAGVTLLNQSVLLKTINDDAETLYRLSKSLFDAGILPYYLHALDPVQGAAHFDAGDHTGISLQKALQGMLPGYLVPRFVREIAGADAKQWIHEA